jgi:hypothetical protein
MLYSRFLTGAGGRMSRISSGRRWSWRLRLNWEWKGNGNGNGNGSDI